MFGKSGAGKTTALLAFLAQFLAVKPRFYLVDGRTASGSFLTSLQRASRSLTSLSMLSIFVVNGATRRLPWAKKESNVRAQER